VQWQDLLYPEIQIAIFVWSVFGGDKFNNDVNVYIEGVCKS